MKNNLCFNWLSEEAIWAYLACLLFLIGPITTKKVILVIFSIDQACLVDIAQC